MTIRAPRLVYVLLLLATIGVARLAQAGAVETTIDNDTDAFVPGPSTTDRNYTQVSRVAWYGSPNEMPGWAHGLADRIGGRDSERRFGLAIGQEIYTPDAISKRTPVLNDRPYAGWLYGSAFVVSETERRERTLEMTAGVVGPKSLASDAQSWWHGELGIRAPRGWQYQLHDEPGVMLRLTERRRPWGRRKHVDLVPHGVAAVGNVLTYAGAGATLRLGAPLPNDFGQSPTTAPGPGERSNKVHLYAFARAEGRAVAHSIFLDGNTLGGSQRVHRMPFVGESQMGFGARWRSVGLRYLFSYTTQEFRERADVHRYGSIGLSF